MKSYTDIEQSKKLTEILPIESADMHWQYIEEDNGQLQWFCFSKDFSINQYNNDPAWSLTALFSVLPEGTRLLKSATDATYHCDCPKGNIDKWFDNPVDACYEMIVKLNELKML